MNLIDELRAYGQKQQDMVVIRAALEHEDWQLPIEHHPRMPGAPLVVPRLVMYGERTTAPPGELWLFSDDEHGQRAAASGRLGTFVAGVPGTQVFRHLDKVTRIDINPGNPKTSHFFFDINEQNRGFFDLFARAVILEKQLARTSLEDPEVILALRSYDGYTVLGGAAGHAMLNAMGLTKALLAWTAPDRMASFHQAVTAPPELTRQSVTGAELFGSVGAMGAGGIILNPFEPDARAIPLEMCPRATTGPA